MLFKEYFDISQAIIYLVVNYYYCVDLLNSIKYIITIWTETVAITVYRLTIADHCVVGAD